MVGMMDNSEELKVYIETEEFIYWEYWEA